MNTSIIILKDQEKLLFNLLSAKYTPLVDVQISPIFFLLDNGDYLFTIHLNNYTCSLSDNFGNKILYAPNEIRLTGKDTVTGTEITIELEENKEVHYNNVTIKKVSLQEIINKAEEYFLSYSYPVKTPYETGQYLFLN